MIEKNYIRGMVLGVLLILMIGVFVHFTDAGSSGWSITVDDVTYDSKTKSAVITGKLTPGANEFQDITIKVDGRMVGEGEVSSWPPTNWKCVVPNGECFGSGKHIVEAEVMDDKRNTTSAKKVVYLPLSCTFVQADWRERQLVGVPIKLIFSHIGGTDVENRFEISSNGGKTWSALRDYQGEDPYTWTPSKVGDYLVKIIAREKGSVGSTVSEQIGFKIVKPVSGIKLSFDKPSPQPVGTSIGLIATPVDGGELGYKFEISKDGKIWQTLSDYFWVNKYSWKTEQAGTYSLRVCAKEELDPQNHEVSGEATYTIK